MVILEIIYRNVHLSSLDWGRLRISLRAFHRTAAAACDEAGARDDRVNGTHVPACSLAAQVEALEAMGSCASQQKATNPTKRQRPSLVQHRSSVLKRAMEAPEFKEGRRCSQRMELDQDLVMCTKPKTIAKEPKDVQLPGALDAIVEDL